MAAGLVCALAPARGALADGYTGVRALGTGGATRAVASGQSALLANPSGMSLIRSYSIEGGYQIGTKDSAHGLHAAVVDSTSGFGLGGGISYTFFRASPDAVPSQTAHDLRFGLSFPFADKVFLGVAGRYLAVTDPKSGSGLTVDAGLTLRPVPEVAAGVAGQNLREIDVGLPLAERAVGYGVAFLGLPDLILLVDGRTVLATALTGDKAKTSVMGGLEYFLAKKVALRAGGGWDALRDAGYASGGVSSVSEALAFDLSASQDVSGDRKLTTLAAGVRIFVPAPP